MKHRQQQIRRIVRAAASPNVVAFPVDRARLPNARRARDRRHAAVVKYRSTGNAA
jgi:hypothetical protein